MREDSFKNFSSERDGYAGYRESGREIQKAMKNRREYLLPNKGDLSILMHRVSRSCDRTKIKEFDKSYSLREAFTILL